MLIMDAETLYSEVPSDPAALSEAMESMVHEAGLIDWLSPLEPEEDR